MTHLHFVGAGGVGMCGLAEVMIREGHTVSGCDAVVSERTARLAELGARIDLGHDAGHLVGVDTVVVTAAVDPQSLEVAVAREQGIPVLRRSELLGELMRGRQGVAVAGTHGKTTTTALAGHILTVAGADPTIIVGGRLHGLEAHARFGNRELLVCEADEYDRSFLELEPVLAVVTNIETEHLECYGSRHELDEAFTLFARRVPDEGAVILCQDDPGASALAARLTGRVITYGLVAEAELRAEDLQMSSSWSRFSVSRHGEAMGRVDLPLVGEHNVANALAAIAVGLELGLPFVQLTAGCASFAGVARRFEVLGEAAGVTVVDDYAHHPSEVEAVLAAARQAFGDRRLVAVFQPHLYSRTRFFAADFGRALRGANVAVVLPVYAAREAPIEGVSAQLVVDEARRSGHGNVIAGPELDDAVAALGSVLVAGDVLLTLGAGDVFRVGEAWLGQGS